VQSLLKPSQFCWVFQCLLSFAPIAAQKQSFLDQSKKGKLPPLLEEGAGRASFNCTLESMYARGFQGIGFRIVIIRNVHPLEVWTRDVDRGFKVCMRMYTCMRLSEESSTRGDRMRPGSTRS
jgi:hypothetical protein